MLRARRQGRQQIEYSQRLYRMSDIVEACGDTDTRGVITARGFSDRLHQAVKMVRAREKLEKAY